MSHVSCSVGMNQCKDDKENVSADLSYQNEFMDVKY